MLRKKIRMQWPLFLIIGFITLVYAPAAFILLHSHEADIAFTQKELRGLADYNDVVEQYFILHQTHDVRNLTTKFLQEKSPEFAELSKTIRNVIRDIGDSSNLILDPQIHSYYAMDILFHYLPLLVEHVELYSRDRLSLIDVPYHMDGLQHAIHIIAQINSPYQPALANSYASIEKLLLSPRPSALSVREAQSLFVSLQTMQQAAGHLLQGLLEQRLSDQQLQYRIVISIVVLVYLVLMALILFAARNYVGRREIELARERQSLILRLEEKNSELEKFSYAAAHDLKEPVRTMRSFTMLLAEEMGEGLSAAAGNYIHILKSTAKRAERMINDLLNYSNIGNETQAMERCDVAEEIDAVLQDLQSRIDEKKAKVTVGEMPQIDTVPSMFRRVILNLVDNAIKYRKEGAQPEIDISASPLLEGWQFCVRDNGIGIAREHLQKVFEPFRRLHSRHSSEGNGIGLTSCKKIIEQLGGRIWLESQPEHGTTVYFVIPAKR